MQRPVLNETACVLTTFLCLPQINNYSFCLAKFRLVRLYIYHNIRIARFENSQFKKAYSKILKQPVKTITVCV